MTDPAGKTVLITGAGGGFGRHMVRQFRAAGAKLILTDVSDDAMRDAASDAGEDLLATLAADLSSEAGCDAIAQLCTVALVTSGSTVPDILVNNAGIAMYGRLHHVPQDRWEKLMQLNLLAPMRLSNRFLPGMVDRGSGHIVNISSIAGWLGSPGLTSYCASKFGLRGFGESLSIDLDGTGVNVSNVYPSFSRTPILDSPQYGYEERRAAPEYLVTDPVDIVAQIIEGVRRKRLHIFPDKHARRIQWITRFAPWLMPMLNRRLEADAIKAAKKAG